MAENLPHEINWHEINFKEEVASTQGTFALRNLVKRLHEAQHNSSLHPTLQGLMFAHDMVLTTRTP